MLKVHNVNMKQKKQDKSIVLLSSHLEGLNFRVHVNSPVPHLNLPSLSYDVPREELFIVNIQNLIT